MKAVVLTLSGFALALSGPVALAQDGGARQTAKLKFTTKRPDAPSGLRLRIDYVNPNDPAAKPLAVRTVTETLARGAAWDTSVPETCTASDPELMLLGAAACPLGSRVGEALITFDTGLPDPGRSIVSPTGFFNNTGEFIFLSRALATDTPRVVTRSPREGRRTVTQVPFLPGSPPDGAAVDTVRGDELVITRRVDGKRHSYITTPPRCPKRGFWVNRIAFTYDDGVSQTVRTRNRCRR